MTRESDPLLRRLQRSAVVFCLGAAALAFMWRGGRADVAAGILAGGGLIATSYWAIRSGIDGALAAWAPRDVQTSLGRAAFVWLIVKFTARYALLGGIAYVMIARLRLHPIGLLAGATSVVAAAAREAIRRAVPPDGSSRKPPKNI